MTECGDVPNSFSTDKVELDKILIQWATLAKKSRTLPAIADWKFNNCRPSINNIKSSHNLKWADIPYKFLEHYADSQEWKDVVDLVPSQTRNVSTVSKSVPEIDGLTFDILKFIPPVVQTLIDNSINEEKAREFEIGVNLVFQMLGFEVTEYGQGTGRKPDGVV